ncbi:hypothetical protein CQ393_12645, partial [Stenotrophomonas sp. MYb238]|nr:hypothetical protein [Stenotrophomonas sp. MYb238]
MRKLSEGSAECTACRGPGRTDSGTDTSDGRTQRASPRTLTPTPAPRPGPCQRRGRSKARAPVARKPSPLAPQREGLNSSPDRRGAWGNLPKKGRHADAPHAVVPEEQRYVRRTLLPAERRGLCRPPSPQPPLRAPAHASGVGRGA